MTLHGPSAIKAQLRSTPQAPSDSFLPITSPCETEQRSTYLHFQPTEATQYCCPLTTRTKRQAQTTAIMGGKVWSVPEECIFWVVLRIAPPGLHQLSRAVKKALKDIKKSWQPVVAEMVRRMREMFPGQDLPRNYTAVSLCELWEQKWFVLRWPKLLIQCASRRALFPEFRPGQALAQRGTTRREVQGLAQREG